MKEIDYYSNGISILGNIANDPEQDISKRLGTQTVRLLTIFSDYKEREKTKSAVADLSGYLHSDVRETTTEVSMSAEFQGLIEYMAQEIENNPEQVPWKNRMPGEGFTIEEDGLIKIGKITTQIKDGINKKTWQESPIIKKYLVATDPTQKYEIEQTATQLRNILN